MTHKEKILRFAATTGLNKTKFCKKCGLSNGYLDSKGSITTDKLVLILENFSELNVRWLLFDEGEMIKNKPYPETKVLNQVSEPDYKTDYKDRYIEVLEENRNLQTKVINLLEINSSFKKSDTQVSNKS